MVRRLGLVLVFALPSGGCNLLGGTHSPNKSGTQIAPANKVYVRNTFDTDPSLYLGRFVPHGEVDLDETAAMQLTCSQYVEHQFIDGGERYVGRVLGKLPVYERE